MNYVGILKACDVPAIDHPLDFDIARALQEVAALSASLKPHLGFSPILDRQIEDATYFAELHLLPEISSIPRAVILFSNFGHLVTIMFPELLSSEKLCRILDEINKGGYHYVPFEALNFPYDGVAPGFNTWRDRYFYFF